ncbi:hypothetical protein [Raineyella sp. LH-20]|uniref:hypothetical protein n=1 Tax=Raineyella sp. LH-20 TaxID=3081204 RepID=UPI002953E2E9|nr:hypothetical protein [Raineyella sp. LH-20]WOP18185.1 hypothetical protein R0146_13260 [Raineyella sp. LH-20]
MRLIGAILSQTTAGWLDALTLRLDVVRASAGPLGHTAAILVAVGACVSILLGRSVVLAVNRMRRGGMVFVMALNFVTLVLTYALLGLLVWVTGVLMIGSHVPAEQVVWAVLWACSPLVLGFATAIPVLGPAIDRALMAWSLLILWSIIRDLYATTLWRSGAIALGTFLAVWALSAVYSPLLARIRDVLWRRATGRPLYDSSRYVLEQATIEGSEADLNGWLIEPDRAQHEPDRVEQEPDRVEQRERR